jgi:hypothetical protein
MQQALIELGDEAEQQEQAGETEEGGFARAWSSTSSLSAM